jgi:hypothetical protein
MKKVLLIVAMLLVVSPVMADVTVTAVPVGTAFIVSGTDRAVTVRVGYTGSTHVRAFALDLSVDSGCTIGKIRDFNVGENNSAKQGYGIFPGRFRSFVNPATPDVCYANATNYNPTPPWGDPGTTGTGLDMGSIIAEMGYLGAGDANMPATSGTLFTIDVNGYGFIGTAHLTISADTMRGGVVDKDTNATTTATNLPFTVDVVFPATCTTPTPEVGALKAIAENAWTGQNFTLSGTAVYDCANNGKIISQDSACVTTPAPIHYTYGVDDQVPNVVGMTRANALAALAAHHSTAGTEVNGFGGAVAVGSVYAQSVASGTSTCTSSVVVLSISSYPIKATAVTNSFYANWVTMGKPACWAYPRQCHGDVDGKKLGNFWVSSNDLTILKGTINKLQSAIPAGGICASFTHKKLGNFWISSNDLTVLKAYVNKLESAIPVCGTPGVSDPNYWYFCVPTGVACPAGVTCATAGSCPNTP